MQQHFERRHSIDIPSLKDVVVELQPVVSSWYHLGLSLGISPHELVSIRKDYRDTHHAFFEMLHMWFEQSVEPTWEAIVEALNEIGHRRQAEKIRIKHCYSQ